MIIRCSEGASHGAHNQVNREEDEGKIDPVKSFVVGNVDFVGGCGKISESQLPHEGKKHRHPPYR